MNPYTRTHCCELQRLAAYNTARQHEVRLEIEAAERFCPGIAKMTMLDGFARAYQINAARYAAQARAILND